MEYEAGPPPAELFDLVIRGNNHFRTTTRLLPVEAKEFWGGLLFLEVAERQMALLIPWRQKAIFSSNRRSLADCGVTVVCHLETREVLINQKAGSCLSIQLIATLPLRKNVDRPKSKVEGTRFDPSLRVLPDALDYLGELRQISLAKRVAG